MRAYAIPPTPGQDVLRQVMLAPGGSSLFRVSSCDFVDRFSAIPEDDPRNHTK
jgi:hypothetical protein